MGFREVRRSPSIPPRWGLIQPHQECGLKAAEYAARCEWRSLLRHACAQLEKVCACCSPSAADRRPSHPRHNRLGWLALRWRQSSPLGGCAQKQNEKEMNTRNEVPKWDKIEKWEKGARGVRKQMKVIEKWKKKQT